MDRRTLLRNAAAYSSISLLGSLAGCAQTDDTGGDDTTPTMTTTEDTDDTSPTMTADSSAASVVVASNETFGEILTDSEGLTLYLFTTDEQGTSACYDGCAETWPPLTVEGTPNPGSDVMAALDTIERRDGSMQVTVADHPLYYYIDDENPGDTNGQGVGDVWFVVGPNGEMKTAQMTTMTEGGGGY